ncbi:ABC transporter permease [Hoylesella saccharolytica]|uniref:ABC transporter permease n=1 Tax=Hoylesella saccharolytica TaxID=633701 RepID=UPI0028E81260|nr:ABC transporter permease [Hoylesella saccharolytica]
MYSILTEIWATTRRNKLRTALTGFAVAWGIFMLIFLLGAGNGLINANIQNMDAFLANSMMVGGGSTSKEYKGLKEGRPITLNDKDIAETKDEFTQNIESVGAEVGAGQQTFAQGDNYVSAQLVGVYPNEITINKKELLYGRFINQPDLDQQRKVVVLSESQAKELLPGKIATLVGQNIKMDNFAFMVAGIYKDDRSEMNNRAFAPFTTVRTIYNKGDKTDNIIFSFKGLNTQAENEAFEKMYRSRINNNHYAAPDDENAVWIWNRFTMNLQMSQGVSIIRTALWIIGIFTLLSGIVGVSNIMLITVKERTREFGIRKAIGATPWSILRLIIIESIIITTIFGYIGMLCGIGANLYMDATMGHEVVDAGIFKQSMFLNPTVGFDVCIEATLLIVIAGTIAGLIPARKAAKIRPIEALNAMDN